MQAGMSRAINAVQATLVELRGSQLMGTRPIPMIGVGKVRFAGLTLPSEDLNRSHHLAPDGASCQERFSFFSLLSQERRRENGDGGSAVVVRLLASCPSSALGGRGKTRAAGSRSSSPHTSVSWFLIYIFL